MKYSIEDLEFIIKYNLPIFISPWTNIYPNSFLVKMKSGDFAIVSKCNSVIRSAVIYDNELEQMTCELFDKLKDKALMRIL